MKQALTNKYGKIIRVGDIIHFARDKCPACDSGILTLRINSKDKSSFLGCSSYPNCKYTTKFNVKNRKNKTLIRRTRCK